MSDIYAMIEEVKKSGLSQSDKDMLIKRIVKEGPGIDLLKAIRELDEQKARISKPSKASRFISPAITMCLILVLAILFAPSVPKPEKPIIWAPSDMGIVGKSVERSSSQSQPAPRKQETLDKGDRGGAHVWTKEFVRQRLLAPSTAKFQSLWGVVFIEMGHDTWKVISYVDSQNAFGVMVRTHFTSVVRYKGDGIWELVSLDM